MKKKYLLALALLVVVVAVVLVFVLKPAKGITIAVPNDPTNEGRALMILEKHGYIKLDPAAGITATVKDIIDNPLDIQFQEVQAEILPRVLQDVDYAIINSNFAMAADLNPMEDHLLMESTESEYANYLCVKQGNEETPAAKALVAALQSKQVADFIATQYGGSALSVVPAEKQTDGYDATVDYAALAAGGKIVVSATPVPHAEILEVVKTILAAKGVELEIVVQDDYVLPNVAVEDGSAFANFFAHAPYQNEYNEENGSHIALLCPVHLEPMAMYGGKQDDLKALDK